MKVSELIAEQNKAANGNVNKKEFGNAFFWATVYGAKGDGINEDTTGIQKALDAASAAGGGICFLPEGAYLISSTLLVASNVVLMGVGNSTIIKLKSGSILNEGMISNSNYSLLNSLTNSGIGIIGLKIDGASVNPTSGKARGIFLNKVSDCFIENVTVIGTEDNGIRIDSTNGTPSEHNVIRRCKVVRTGKADPNIMLRTYTDDGSNSTNVPRATVFNKVTDCISIGGSHGISCFNIAFSEIANNRCIDNTDRGILLSPTCEDSSVIGNLVLRAGSTGIHMAYSCKRCIVEGNRAIGTVADGSGLGQEGQGIKAYAGFEGLTIVGNHCQGNATDGIALEGGGDGTVFTITGNTCLNNLRDGIRVYAGSITLVGSNITDGVISGNTCKGNSKSGIRLGSDNAGANKPQQFTINSNTLIQNSEYGIHAEYLLNTFIGTNFALLNGLGNANVSFGGIGDLLPLRYIGTKKESFAASIPASATGWNNGDIVWNLSPAAGGYIGWVLIAGVWKGYGLIQA